MQRAAFDYHTQRDTHIERFGIHQHLHTAGKLSAPRNPNRGNRIGCHARCPEHRHGILNQPITQPLIKSSRDDSDAQAGAVESKSGR